MSAVDRGFDAAFAASVFSNAPRTALRMGACLMAGSRILSVGANRWHTHTDSDNSRGFCRSLHAEHVALLRRQHYDKPRGRLTLFVARHLADGTTGNSRPCNNCLRLCELAGVSRVWFYEHGLQQEITL
jgi:deoxycytidylate deaminase